LREATIRLKRTLMRVTKNIVTRFVFGLTIGLFCNTTVGQEVDTARYVGSTLSNIDYHHGQLRPAIGTHATQIMRASREHPQTADDMGWTYNHAPNMAYWNDTFFVQYLNDSISEHVPPSTTL